MTDKAYHRDALVIGGVVVVALLLWFFVNRGQTQASANTPPNPVTQSPMYVFNIPGQVSNWGPVNFPANVYEFPAISNPQGTITEPGAPILAPISSNCLCGCNGSGGQTSYIIPTPDFSGVINTLLQQGADLANNLLSAEYSSLGYSLGTFVSNATPTIFEGGNFGT